MSQSELETAAGCSDASNAFKPIRARCICLLVTFIMTGILSLVFMIYFAGGRHQSVALASVGGLISSIALVILVSMKLNAANTLIDQYPDHGVTKQQLQAHIATLTGLEADEPLPMDTTFFASDEVNATAD